MIGQRIESKTFENRIKKPSGQDRTSWKMLGLDPIPTSFQSHPPTPSAHFSSGDLAGRVWVGSQGEALRTARWKFLELGHPSLDIGIVFSQKVCWMSQRHQEYPKALKDIQYYAIYTSQTSLRWASRIQTNISRTGSESEGRLCAAPSSPNEKTLLVQSSICFVHQSACHLQQELN